MIDADNSKPGLDSNFRQYALKNLIIKTLKEWTHNSKDPNVINKINRISQKFEDKVYKETTNKDDYLKRMSHQLKKSKNKVLDVINANATGNQPVSTAIQKQVVPSCPTQQNPERAPLTSMHQKDVTQPVLNKSRPDREFGQQNASLKRSKQLLHSPAYQQPVSVAEPVQTSNHMFNMDRYQQSMEVVPPISNISVPEMPRLAPASRPLHPVMSSEEQRNQFQDGRMSGSQFHPQNLIHENRSTLQSPIPAAKAPTDSAALLASTDSGTTNAVDWQDIIEQFQRLKSTLPIIHKLLETAEYQCARAPNAEQVQKFKKSAVWYRKMIQFLHIPEQELMRKPKEKSTSFMNFIMHSLQNAQKINMNNQLPQDSLGREHVGANRPPSTPVDSKSMISQSSVDRAFPNPDSQSSGTSSSTPNAPRNATIQVTLQQPLYQGPTGILDHNNTGIKRKQIPQLSMNQAPSAPWPPRMPQNLQEKKIDLVNLRADPVSRTYEPSSVLAKQTNDVSVHLSTGTDSQAIPAAHLPLTRVRSPSIPEEIPASQAAPAAAHLPLTRVKSPSVASGDSKTQADTDEEAHFISFEQHDAPALSPHVTKQPIERLVEVVQSMSRGALIESVDDIISVHDFLSSLGGNFSHKRPKIEHSIYELMEEVGKMNQRLVETVIEVVSDSNEVAGIHGTVVKFTYRPVGSLAASFPALSPFSVKLNVPSKYPDISPQVLDRLPEECSEPKDLLQRIQKLFQHDIRRLSTPMALGDMAQAWDDSARSVFTDFALSVGAKSFSSMYGTWECCGPS